MDPKDRLETVAKTKLAAKREQVAAGDEPAEGARYRVPQADADRIIEGWPAAPKKVAQSCSRSTARPTRPRRRC
jgi:hypothetical protein